MTVKTKQSCYSACKLFEMIGLESRSMLDRDIFLVYNIYYIHLNAFKVRTSCNNIITRRVVTTESGF